MVLKSGTPLWVTILIAFITLLGGHFLTLFRDKASIRRERRETWLSACNDLMDEIEDDATTHYFDEKSIESTVVSAAKINNSLKRLGALARELPPKDTSDKAQLEKILRQLRDLITDPPDFQDCNRKVRPAKDSLVDDIGGCVQSIKSNLRKPRKKKP